MSNGGIAPVHHPIIKSSPLFVDLSELELNAVSAFLEPRRVKKDEIIFNEGATGEEMFILISGQISAWISQSGGTQRQMFKIKPGDFFGEMSVIANESRSATTAALVDTELLTLHGIDFYRIIYEHPMIGIKMLKAIGRVQNTWLQETSKNLGDLLRWGETARRRAITDDLTALYNRSFLEKSARDRFERYSVGLRSISLLLMDLDKFHAVNQRFGQKAGDLVFVATADVLRSVTRGEDIGARLSGDEFAVLLPDTNIEEASVIAERVRYTMASRKVLLPVYPDTPASLENNSGKAEISVHVSIGIASAPDHADNWDALFQAADAALFRAKEAGRDKVEVAK